MFSQMLIKNIITEKFDELLKYRFIEYLNPREWAILTWIFIILFAMMFHSNLRSSLLDILKSIRGLIIQPVFIVFFIYQLMLMFGACYFHVQGITVSAMKDYLILFFFTVVPFLTKVKFNMFWRALIQSVGFGAFVQFLLSTYTFSYVWEFILVPVTTIIAIVGIQAEHENSVQVAKILNSVLGVIGIFFIVHAGYCLISDIKITFQPIFWEGYVIEPVTWLANIPLVILAIPMVQFDVIDNFRIKKKNIFRLLGHSISFIVIRFFYFELVILNVRRYVLHTHFGGLVQSRIQISLKQGVSERQAKMVQHLYQYMLAPRTDYPEKKRIIPIRIECREIDENDFKIPVYEISNLLDEYKFN
ncbi:hypothetical protein [Lactiplantibacillus nangangensis]|uniref:hypothetical protein n=1 Tax=Lactiplantibacillus nangangensis TaxID=2559917 RepID=UPI0021DF55FC|nr:hypothetical protein [Lactiplantibacillus nangangensis]